jgi:hypothetical protein
MLALDLARGAVTLFDT